MVGSRCGRSHESQPTSHEVTAVHNNVEEHNCEVAEHTSHEVKASNDLLVNTRLVL
jgi:hypothetical protein